MIDFRLDQDRKRVLLSQISGVGSGVMRHVAELSYNLMIDTEWCDVVAMEHEGAEIRVHLIGRPRGREVRVTISDVITCDSKSALVDRRWTIMDPGGFRFFFDYRVLTPSRSLVLPSAVVAFPGDHPFRSTVVVDQNRLTVPAAFVFGPEICHGIQLHTLPPDCSATWECATDDRQPAVQIRIPADAGDNPVQLEPVGKKGGPREVRVRISVGIQARGGPLLRSAHGSAWSVDRNEDLDPLAPDLLRYAAEKRSFIESHMVRWRDGAAGAGPARDSRRSHPARLHTAGEPYGGLASALALLLHPAIRTQTHLMSLASETALFFSEGLENNGRLRDAFDPTSRRWGTVEEGVRFLFSPGPDTRAVRAAILFARIYETLRDAGEEQLRLIRVAAEISHRAMQQHDPDGSFGDGTILPRQRIRHTSLVVSLLSTLERVRGRHSSRVGTLKRATAYLSRIAETGDWMVTLGASALASADVLRACLDLSERGYLPKDHPLLFDAGAMLLNWLMTRDVRFPRRSRAAQLEVRTRGLAVVSTDRPHLDLDVLPIALELLRWSVVTGDAYARGVAKTAARAAIQLVGEGKRTLTGEQPAEIDFVEWSSHGADRGAPGRIQGARTIQASSAAITAMDICRLFPSI